MSSDALRRRRSTSNTVSSRCGVSKFTESPREKAGEDAEDEEEEEPEEPRFLLASPSEEAGDKRSFLPLERSSHDEEAMDDSPQGTRQHNDRCSLKSSVQQSSGMKEIGRARKSPILRVPVDYPFTCENDCSD